MDSMEMVLMGWGCPSYATTIFTPLTDRPVSEIKIGDQLQTNIGWIFGLATYCDTVTPTNDQLISTTDAQNLYFTLKYGSTNFYEQTRLDDFLTVYAGTPNQRPKVYSPVSIPGNFDLSNSFYSNPTGIVNPPGITLTIALRVHFISVEGYNILVDKGVMTRYTGPGEKITRLP